MMLLQMQQFPENHSCLVFATPKAHGIYQGFEYDAIAIAYENSDIVNVS